jgi:chloramphenicol O-acetyltransferase type A
MKQEVNPKDTCRARAFDMWMQSPMPMVTLTKTFNVTRIRKLSKRTGMKFNMLLCWCVGKAASKIEEFYMLPEGGKLYKYDRLAINVIVNNANGGICSCDIPYGEDLQQFNTDYMILTRAASVSCESTSLEDSMVIGTSAVVTTELDSIVNQYSGVFNNPFLAWSRFRRCLMKTTLGISFQFHHVQMDGGQAAMFLNELQNTINKI